MRNIEKLLRAIVEAGASDLHLAASNPPVARVNGELKMVQGEGELTQRDLQEVLEAITSPENLDAFRRDKELDFSYEVQGLACFRANACYQRGTIGLSLRVLPPEIPSPAELGIPPACLDLVSQLRGLILVTGSTGSGKSTTLAAMVNHLNETANCRIIILEDPIEFVHRNKKCMII